MNNRILTYPLVLIGLLLFLTISCNKDDNTAPPNIVRDIEGNIYHTVTIGTQVWMVENLKTTKYRDGTSIPNITDYESWYTTPSGAYCDYDNTPSNSEIYGRLYNWYTVTNIHKIAPVGWHVPSDEEWTTLFIFLGGNSIAGGKIKEEGITHWFVPNSGATNESGFKALPGGFRNYILTTGQFAFDYSDIGFFGCFWSSSEFTSSNGYAKVALLSNTNNRVSLVDYFFIRSGCSVRCIKDTLTVEQP